jgi:replicative superfamily II helicase
MSAFAGCMGWVPMEKCFAVYAKEVLHGLQEELLPLMEVTGVKQSTATALYRAGFRTVESLALASAKSVASVVHLGGQNGDDESRRLAIAKRIIASANAILRAKRTNRCDSFVRGVC